MGALRRCLRAPVLALVLLSLARSALPLPVSTSSKYFVPILVAGGSAGSNDGTGPGAQFSGLPYLAYDGVSVLYVVDNNLLRSVVNGVVTTLPMVVLLTSPTALCVDRSTTSPGTVYIGDATVGLVVRFVNGTSSVICDTTTIAPATDLAGQDTLPCSQISACAVEASGLVIVGTTAGRIFRINPVTATRASPSPAYLVGSSGVAATVDGDVSVAKSQATVSCMVHNPYTGIIYFCDNNPGGPSIRQIDGTTVSTVCLRQPDRHGAVSHQRLPPATLPLQRRCRAQAFLNL